jgi:putative isomerase
LFDISKVPFSRYGSYFVWSQDEVTKELFLRDVHGGDEAPSRLFKVEVLKKEALVPFSLVVNETKLTIKTKACNQQGLDEKFPNIKNTIEEFINICISEYNIVHIEGRGLGLRFTAVKTKYDNVLQYETDKWEYHFYSKEIKLMVARQNGNIEMKAPWKIIGNEFIEMDLLPEDGYMHFTIESYKTIWKHKIYDAYKVAQNKVDNEYENWLATMPEVPEKYYGSKLLASYITWSCVVHAEGRLTRNAMFMSKNWMYNIWSWDNCFNALMLGKSHPELALDQLMLFVDNQDESGIYADFINDKFCSFSCCKPPIHAWAYKRLRSKNDYFNKRKNVEMIYKSLSKSTEYWLVNRTRDKNRLPVYNHGNDSGWDNASVFHMGIPVEAPDLAAHLIRQMDILSEMAEELLKHEEAIKWKKKSDEMYDLLIKRLLTKEGFIAISSLDNTNIKNTESLLLRMPIVIGYRMPVSIKNRIVMDFKEKFECKYGLVTEAIGSQLYKKNGYWLGPIWAPVMYLIIDALKECGYGALAADYAGRFCDATLIGGMAENFDPLTAEGLVDPAFTWTSSVFLMLTEEYLV